MRWLAPGQLLVTGLQVLPFLLLAPWAGMIADRFPKRRVLFVTQTALLVTALLLAVLVLVLAVMLPIVAMNQLIR